MGYPSRCDVFPRWDSVDQPWHRQQIFYNQCIQSRPFGILDSIFHSLRSRQILSHTGSAPLNDCIYVLSDLGRQHARSEMEACAYVGPAPVLLDDYLMSVEAQTMREAIETMARERLAENALQGGPGQELRNALYA